jgi:hypothetical protein
MCQPGTVIKPDAKTVQFHERKYRIFRELYEQQRQRRIIMQQLKEAQ